MSELTAEAEGPHAYERDKVIKIISSVIQKVEHAEDLSREQLYKELNELHDIIEEARHELSEFVPAEIGDKHIPDASDELEAIVTATEEATSTIMDSCEVIENVCETAEPEVAEALMNEVTKIYEACSFQDITGQRITKVAFALSQIDEKVNGILKIISSKLPGIKERPTDQAMTDEDLLNGPQLPDNAISQDEIDKLLAEFD